MGQLHFDARLRFESGFGLDAKFDACPGVTALFGPSGSGKTTVLALIAGVLRPRDGVIRLGNRTLVDTRLGIFVPPEKRRIGIVFQDHLLFPHMTVRKNLVFGHGRRDSQGIDCDRVVKILEIGALLDRYPKTLSGGERQRVALGRAILRGPELLLMDEPLAAINQDLKDRILTYLERAIAEWHIPTLFVSHDQDDVKRLTSNVVTLDAGKTVRSDPSLT